MINDIQTNYITRFKAALQNGMDCIVEASSIYVQAIDENPNLKQLFIEECSDFIPPSAWPGFEAVGRNLIHPNLIMGGGGKCASKIRRLPKSDQDAIFSGKRFEMLTTDGQVLNIDVRQVEPEQAEQLFDATHIRTIAEQKAFLESRKVKPCEVVDVMPYVITDGQVTFRRMTKLSKTELRRILQEM